MSNDLKCLPHCVLVSLHAAANQHGVESWRWRVWPMNAPCNWVDLFKSVQSNSCAMNKPLVSSEIALFDAWYHFLLVICGNNVYFAPFTKYHHFYSVLTACNLVKSHSFDTTVEITDHTCFPINALPIQLSGQFPVNCKCNYIVKLARNDAEIKAYAEKPAGRPIG